jgi:hypothetical protein
MDRCIEYVPPLNPVARIRSEEDWYLAESAFDKGDPRGAVEHLFRYLGFGDLAASREIPLEFSLAHGSVRLRFRFDDTSWRVEAPFVRLPGGASSLPLMRQILEINTGLLTISRIALRGGESFLEAGDTLANGHPSKILGVIEEMCECADEHDDVFVHKFGAVRLDPDDPERFPEETLERAWELYRSLLEQASQTASWFELRREFGTAWDTLATGFLRVQHTLFPQGYLGIELRDALALLYGEEPVEQRLARTLAKLRKLLTISPETFRACLFRPRFIVSPRTEIEIPNIQSQLSWHHETAGGLIAERRYRTAALCMVYVSYYLLAAFSMPADIATVLTSALTQCSEREWKAACEILYRALDGIMARKIWAAGPQPGAQEPTAQEEAR